MSRLVSLLLVSLAACGTAQPGGMSGPTISGRVTEADVSPLESADILRRTQVAQPVYVKHILIGWGELEDNYGGKMGAKARARNRFDAEALVRQLQSELAGGAPIEPLMIEHSGDPGTSDGTALRVTGDSSFVPRFIALSIRLAVAEVGVVRTPYGFHIIKRVK